VSEAVGAGLRFVLRLRMKLLDSLVLGEGGWMDERVGWTGGSSWQVSISDLSTVVLVEPGDVYYTKSTAILLILSRLTFPFSLASALLCFPSYVRDFGYWCVATSRYSVFGKKDTCEYRPEWRDRFMSESPQCIIQAEANYDKLCWALLECCYQ